MTSPVWVGAYSSRRKRPVRDQDAIKHCSATRKLLTYSPHPCSLSDPRRENHDPGPRGRAPVEINGVLIDHPNAAGGNAPADCPRLVGAVDAVEGILVALPQVHGASAERVARP